MHNDLCILIIFLQYLSSIYLLNANLCILIIFLQPLLRNRQFMCIFNIYLVFQYLLMLVFLLYLPLTNFYCCGMLYKIFYSKLYLTDLRDVATSKLCITNQK